MQSFDSIVIGAGISGIGHALGRLVHDRSGLGTGIGCAQLKRLCQRVRAGRQRHSNAAGRQPLPRLELTDPVTSAPKRSERLGGRAGVSVVTGGCDMNLHGCAERRCTGQSESGHEEGHRMIGWDRASPQSQKQSEM